MDEADRLAVQRCLEDLGATPAQIAEAERAGHLAGLASDLVLSAGATLSARDVAERCGVTPGDVVGLFRQFGVIVPDVDEPLFDEADVELVRPTHWQSVKGAAGPDFTRVVAAAMDRIADAAVAFYVQGAEYELVAADAPVAAQTESNARVTRLALELGRGLGVLFRHHMRQAIARQRVVQADVSRRELARLAIGFVDLVGSTALEAGLDPPALAAMVSRFEARAFDVTTAAGGRLVKFIGDEIMVAALDPTAGCRIMRELVAAFTADGLQPRGGLTYGEVLFRHGDYYGPVVNLAARLADEAIPGEVLVDGQVVAATAGDGPPPFAPAGRRQVKGFETPVAVWTLA